MGKDCDGQAAHSAPPRICASPASVDRSCADTDAAARRPAPNRASFMLRGRASVDGGRRQVKECGTANAVKVRIGVERSPSERSGIKGPSSKVPSGRSGVSSAAAASSAGVAPRPLHRVNNTGSPQVTLNFCFSTAVEMRQVLFRLTWVAQLSRFGTCKVDVVLEVCLEVDPP